MTHHSPHEAEDDETLQFGNREMVRRGNEGPRSLDFFLHGQQKEKKRRELNVSTRVDGPREEFTSSLEDEKQRLDKIRKGEIIFFILRFNMCVSYLHQKDNSFRL